MKIGMLRIPSDTPEPVITPHTAYALLSDDECREQLIREVAKGRMLVEMKEELVRYVAKVSPEVMQLDISHVRRLLLLAEDTKLSLDVVFDEYRKFIADKESAKSKQVCNGDEYRITEE